MTTLVAGCGYVGSAVAELLQRMKGEVVYGLRRHEGALPDGVRSIVADLTDRAALSRAIPDDIDALVYSAAADERTDAAYEAAYVRGLDNVLEVLRARGAPVKRVVFTSSTAVYAQAGGEWVDESSPTEPRSFTGARMLEAERVAVAGPFPAVVLRLAGIYGPGRDRIVRQVAAGEARRPALAIWTNRIHRDDCAGAIAHLLSLDAPPPLVIGADDEPAELGAIMTWVAEQLGVAPPPVSSDPADAARRGGSKRCRNARLVASGYTFCYPTYREGYRDAIDAARGRPEE